MRFPTLVSAINTEIVQVPMCIKTIVIPRHALRFVYLKCVFGSEFVVDGIAYVYLHYVTYLCSFSHIPPNRYYEPISRNLISVHKTGETMFYKWENVG
jgi:hypothetical protein